MIVSLCRNRPNKGMAGTGPCFISFTHGDALWWLKGTHSIQHTHTYVHTYARTHMKGPQEKISVPLSKHIYLSVFTGRQELSHCHYSEVQLGNFGGEKFLPLPTPSRLNTTGRRLPLYLKETGVEVSVVGQHEEEWAECRVHQLNVHVLCHELLHRLLPCIL